MGFAHGLWIDWRRGGGWLVLGVMVVAAVVTDLRFVIWDTSREGSGAPSWYRITAVGTDIAGTYPLIAAYGAWLGSRAGRDRTLEIEGLPRRFFIGSAAPSLGAMAIWVGGATVLTYLAAATYTILRARAVSGTMPAGTVPWQSGIVILAAMIAVASIGYLLGRLIPNLFVPVLAAAGVFFLFQLPSMVGGERPTYSSLDAIIPTNLTQAMAPYIGDQVYPRLFWTSLAWFLSLVAVVVCVLALWRVRKAVPIALLAGSLAIAATAALSVVRAYDASGEWHAANRGVICVEHTGVRFCAPPAAMTDDELRATATAYDALVPAWFPRDLLPETFSLVIAGDQLPPGTTEMIVLQQSQADRTWMEINAWTAIITGRSSQLALPSATQLVVACAMIRAKEHDCGTSFPDPAYQRVPDMSQTREGQAMLEAVFPTDPRATPPSDADIAELEIDLSALQRTAGARIDAFLALPDPEKASWLSAHWERLRSGDLTLEDVP